MKISLSVDTYKGVDGSSLSPTRCTQIVKVFEMLETFGNEMITYVGIQELAESQKLFGSTAAKSAIRTFFPLLKKLGFVNYDGEFPANKCFTNLGHQFVLVCRALDNITDQTRNKEEIRAKLINIKRNIQKQGLIDMHSNQTYEKHNIWLALKLFQRFRVIHWNEFLFLLHCVEFGKSVEDALTEISHQKDEIEEYEFVNEKGNPLPNTCYSYLRGLLIETGLIENLSSSISTVTVDADEFFHAIKL
ncbi:MAG: hypothetical protein NC453_17745 [Muribaculum sp.]|nr:hypothetical protein [Muribaculum sp.]